MNELDYDYDGFAAVLKVEAANELDLSKSTLLELLDEYCRHFSLMSPKIVRNHSCLRKKLVHIERDFQCTLMPVQVTDLFWAHFIGYCINVAHLAVSSVGTCCSQLKSILSWGAKHNVRLSSTFDELRAPAALIKTVALSADEVSHIYHLDLSHLKCRPQHKKTLEQVRDMFVLSCNLGQRHSDMIRIEEGCFDRHFFTILQQKTGQIARVDIERFAIDMRQAMSILEKYNFAPPIRPTSAITTGTFTSCSAMPEVPLLTSSSTRPR